MSYIPGFSTVRKAAAPVSPLAGAFTQAFDADTTFCSAEAAGDATTAQAARIATTWKRMPQFYEYLTGTVPR